MKFPKIPHLPWSKSISNDDKVIRSIDFLKNKPLIYTEKMDGENTCFGKHIIHARSTDSQYNNPWQTYMKREWNNFKHLIPEQILIYAENMYSIHSIEYEKLNNYFYVFSMFDMNENEFLSWDNTVNLCNELDFKTTPFILKSTKLIELDIPETSMLGNTCEGYVVRNANSFKKNTFHENIAKCVRANHVQTDEHWTKKWKKAELNEK